MKIAAIVGSNSHVVYIARLFDEAHESSDMFGTFVSMTVGNDKVVGVIGDSRLTDPDIARRTPGARGEGALGAVSDELFKTKNALIAIVLLGRMSNGIAHHEVPRGVIAAGTEVNFCDNAEIENFHRGSDGHIQLHYLSEMIAQAGVLGIPLARSVLDRLILTAPESDVQYLSVIADSLAWKRSFGESHF